MSEVSIYYDAGDDWIGDDDLVEFEENALLSFTPISPTPVKPIMNRKEEIATLMAATFNVNHFLPNQYEAISAALDGHDVFVVLPKGEQRNMCYQLPVLFQHPKLTTIIIVPTLFYLLQQDNHNMDRHQIPTAFINKSKDSFKRNWIPLHGLDTCILRKMGIVYMTFDTFSKSSWIIQELYQQNLLARIVIDEAHCLSQWAPEFIFGFLRITENLKSMYPNVPITAFTAISNERVHIDIMHKLSIQNTCKIFKRSIFL